MSDDGRGFNPETAAGMGLMLTRLLVDRINDTLSMASKKGTSAVVTLKL